jgi:hypothetical protein
MAQGFGRARWRIARAWVDKLVPRDRAQRSDEKLVSSVLYVVMNVFVAMQ